MTEEGRQGIRETGGIGLETWNTDLRQGTEDGSMEQRLKTGDRGRETRNKDVRHPEDRGLETWNKDL